MIAYLRGRILEKDAESAVVDVNGVGYQVALSPGAVDAVGPLGVEARLWIYTHAISEGGLALYGFVDREERGLFETLLGVQGVGPKVALAILAGLPPADLRTAIANADVARLTQIRGVGRKTAERLAVELRDRLVPFPVAPTTNGVPAAGAGAAGAARRDAPALPGSLAEVQGALAGLGYRPVEVEPLLARMDPAEPVEDLLRQALAALRRV